MSNPDMLGPASLAITQAVGAFTTFLPPLTEVRKADPLDEGFRADVRIGEFAATALTVGISVIVSNMTGSPIPAFVAAALCIGLVSIYETALNNTRALETK